MRSALCLVVLLMLLTACGSDSADDSHTTAQQPPVYTFEVVHIWPHDSSAFTQGLVFHEGAFYESTGLHGASSLRKVELQTGKVLEKVNVPSEYFAEGLALFGGRLFQLTWQAHKGFIYDLDGFRVQGEFPYAGRRVGADQR